MVAEVRFIHNQDKPTISFYQHAIREWAGEGGLDAQEMVIMWALIDRTIGWGKWSVELSLNKVYHGDSLYKGLKQTMGIASFKRKIKSLRERGVIRTWRTEEKSGVEVNTGWRPEMALRVPKRKKNETKVDHWGSEGGITMIPEGDHSDTGVVSQRSTIESNQEKEVRRTKSTDADAPRCDEPAGGPDEVQKKINEAIQKNSAAREKKKSKAVRNNDYEAIWRNSMVEVGMGLQAPTFTQKQWAIIKRVAALYSKTNLSFTSLLEWSVLNWPAIMTRQFGWVKNPAAPMTPSVDFFIRHHRQFNDCLAEGKLRNWLLKGEADQIRKLMAKGKTREQALVDIAKKRASRGLRDEMQKREKDVRDKEVMTRRRLEEAKARERLSRPMHPQSPAAQKLRRMARGDDTPPEAKETDAEVLSRPLSAPALPERNPFDD